MKARVTLHGCTNEVQIFNTRDFNGEMYTIIFWASTMKDGRKVYLRIKR